MNEIVGDIPLYIKADGIWSVSFGKMQIPFIVLNYCHLSWLVMVHYGLRVPMEYWYLPDETTFIIAHLYVNSICIYKLIS
ncbi:hypothetical protein GDO81_007425 [Engystomops pustulosus]|uniref:Uncharacterized protein n=1 Tax=Engystomops pustulosus TaxID=76066 RepID=A0AAV7C730_ENGPU|nr:hypothetical protein GDO81_007425 [Engystomops pustulosus]